MAKQPYLPLYTGDYLKDTRKLPLNVRGAWVDIMIFMWDSKERGVLEVTMPELSRMLSCETEEANFAIGLLFEKGVCDFEILPNGMTKMISRRMVRDVELSKKRADAGSMGGRPKTEKQNIKQNESKSISKTKANTDNDNDNDNEIDVVIENKKESEEKTNSLVVENVPRGTDESLWEVEQWTEDVLKGNDEVFLNMVKNLTLNGKVNHYARSHLGLCSRYGWHKKMDSQQAFRNSLINHITENLRPDKHDRGTNKGTLAAAGTEVITGGKGFGDIRRRNSDG